MKKLIVCISLISLFFLVVPTYAQTITPVNKFDAAREKLQQKIQERTNLRTANITQRQEQVAVSLKERAVREIDRRVVSLSALLTRLNEIKRLTADQKSKMVNQIQTEISNLTSLKAKINADTDNTTLKSDVQSIIKDFRTYALFMPKVNVLRAADELANVSDKMSSLAAKLQTRVNEAKAKGEDVASLTSLLADIQTKIADAKNQSQNATSTVLPLSPDGFPGNKVQLQSARMMIFAGSKYLKLARQDMEKILQGLRKEEITPTEGAATNSALPSSEK